MGIILYISVIVFTANISSLKLVVFIKIYKLYILKYEYLFNILYLYKLFLIIILFHKKKKKH